MGAERLIYISTCQVQKNRSPKYLENLKFWMFFRRKWSAGALKFIDFKEIDSVKVLRIWFRCPKMSLENFMAEKWCKVSQGTPHTLFSPTTFASQAILFWCFCEAQAVARLLVNFLPYLIWDFWLYCPFTCVYNRCSAGHFSALRYSPSPVKSSPIENSPNLINHLFAEYLCSPSPRWAQNSTGMTGNNCIPLDQAWKSATCLR